MVSSEWQMPPCFYEDVNGKCLHEMANAYTDTCQTIKNGQKFHFSGPQTSDLEMKNIHPKFRNENVQFWHFELPHFHFVCLLMIHIN